MTVRDLERLYDYSSWANRKLAQVLAQLTPEQLTQPVAGSYGSIRNTLVHMMSAEWGWLDRCGGRARGPALSAADFPDLASIMATWGAVETSMREFLSTLRDDDLARIVEFKIPPHYAASLEVGALLQHAINHGTHHRGQLALLLRELGHVPGNIDLLIYDIEKRSAVAG